MRLSREIRACTGGELVYLKDLGISWIQGQAFLKNLPTPLYAVFLVLQYSAFFHLHAKFTQLTSQCKFEGEIATQVFKCVHCLSAASDKLINPKGCTVTTMNCSYTGLDRAVFKDI